MTYKFVAVKERSLTLPVPIYGEEPVTVQFQLGFFETDDDFIGISMRKHSQYGVLFYEFGDMPKPKEKPVEKKASVKKPVKKKTTKKVTKKSTK